MKKILTTKHIILSFIFFFELIFSAEITIKLSPDLFEGNFQLKAESHITIDNISYYKSTNIIEGKVVPSFSLGLEITTRLLNNFLEVGIGSEYQFPRTIFTLNGQTPAAELKFWFLPIYALCRTYVKINDSLIFGKLQVGYNILHDGNKEYKNSFRLVGGLHYGIGLGVSIEDNVNVELLYSVYEGEHLYRESNYMDGKKIYTEIKYTDKYSKIAVQLGFRFRI